jgi:hypothetical protein
LINKAVGTALDGTNTAEVASSVIEIYAAGKRLACFALFKMESQRVKCD